MGSLSISEPYKSLPYSTKESKMEIQQEAKRKENESKKERSKNERDIQIEKEKKKQQKESGNRGRQATTHRHTGRKKIFSLIHIRTRATAILPVLKRDVTVCIWSDY